MATKANTTSDDLQKSTSAIYAEILAKRRKDKEEKDAKKAAKKEVKAQEKIERKEDDDRPLSRKEKNQRKLESWKEIMIGLTGDDLEYEAPKKGRRKYRKWIDEDADTNVILTGKPKKKKKRNYNKEFEPELNLLKALVTDSKKFTDDLLKRYITAAGPNTKDGMPLNKTLVELAAVINNSRSNSLSTLREIGSLKKTIADLYFKQKKEDREAGGGGFDATDVGLLGSKIASGLGSGSFQGMNPMGLADVPVVAPATTGVPSHQPGTSSAGYAEDFDPDNWEGIKTDDDDMSRFEKIPHKLVVEWDAKAATGTIKALNTDTNTYIDGYPIPPFKIKTMDMDQLLAKDDYDKVYPVMVVNQD